MQKRATAAAEAAAEAAAIMHEREQIKADLKAEPAADCPHGVLTCLFKFPDGAKVKRRFELNEAPRTLFNFVESEGAGGLAPRSYFLVTQFPRRVLKWESPATLKDHKFSPGQEVFMLEPL